MTYWFGYASIVITRQRGAGGCVEQGWHGEPAVARQPGRPSERPRRGRTVL